MNNEYTFKFLFDNGVTESLKTGEISEIELSSLMELVKGSFESGLNGYLKFPCEHGIGHIIDLSKVTKVHIF